MDIDLGPGMDGTEAATEILAIREVPIVFLTSHGEGEMVERVKGITRYGYVLKNAGEFVLLESVTMAFELFYREYSMREAWRESQHFQKMLRSMVEHNPTPVILLDRELRYRMVSNAFLTQYGLDEGEVIGKRHYDLFPDIPDKWRQVHQRALAGEVLRSEEDFMVRTDGSITFNRWECRPWHGADGSIHGILLYTEEITEEKERRTAMRSMQGTLDALMRYIPDLVCVLDPWGYFTFVSDSVCEATGKAKEQIIGKKVEEVLPSETAARLRRLLDEVVATKRRTLSEDDVINALGRRIYRTLVFPVDYRNRGVSLIGVVSVDMTDTLSAKRRLEVSERRWKYALEGAGDALWDLNLSTGEVYVTERWREMLGFANGEIDGDRSDWEKLLHPEDAERVLAAFEATLSGEREEYREEYRLRRKDGSYTWILDRGKVVERDSKGEPLRMIGTHTDITERKEAQARTQELMEQRELMVREGHHRIKNDMQSVRSLLSLQANRAAEEGVRGALEEAAGRIEVIASLYDAIYRGEVGDRQRDVRTVVEEAVRSIAARLGADAPRASVTGEAGAVTLRGATPLAIVINELLTNAGKYGRQGEKAPSVRISLEPRPDGSRAITVADDGPGFSPAVLAREVEGFGLSVVRAFVSQLEGEITLENAPDGGAQVTLTLGREA